MQTKGWRTLLHLSALAATIAMACSPIAAAAVGQSAATNKTSYRFPAEWETQRAVWLDWYAKNEYGQETTDAMHAVTAQIIEALHAHHVAVEMIVDSETRKAEVLNFLAPYRVDPAKIRFHVYADSYLFMRDMGPLFLKTNDGKPLIADFAWNYYGIWSEAKAKPIGDVDKAMAAERNIPLVKSHIVAEGGGIEVNGEGVMMTYKDTALQRNPGKSLAEIESEYLRLYGQKKIIWLPRSPLSDKLTADGSPIIENFFGYGANGHVDEVARFVDPHTILVAQVSREARDSNALEKADYERIEEAVETLKRATDTHGKPFRIIRVQNPNLSTVWNEHTVETGDAYKQFGFQVGDTVYELPAASYLNFLISNGVVIAAKYWEPGKPESLKRLDAQAKAALKQAFPDRDIVQINPLAINWWGGGIHCITQQEPLFENAP
ncbi:agmatine deiminase family protein [Brevibacillus fluminis]|uniref:Agmatine deiminase family protein n=1 Tax=Brevibacillus fluminis TaxID=511487 RepID=A0A3M8DW82_9BACL|nr:agmatine deiminase family protein [Brevibacillus fluminis]RNB92352.1 agmatine deiminase family protein [Brevibacillus fluminis]